MMWNVVIWFSFKLASKVWAPCIWAYTVWVNIAAVGKHWGFVMMCNRYYCNRHVIDCTWFVRDAYMNFKCGWAFAGHYISCPHHQPLTYILWGAASLTPANFRQQLRIRVTPQILGLVELLQSSESVADWKTSLPAVLNLTTLAITAWQAALASNEISTHSNCFKMFMGHVRSWIELT